MGHRLIEDVEAPVRHDRNDPPAMKWLRLYQWRKLAEADVRQQGGRKAGVVDATT
jgi:hypothetical protein